LLSEQAEIQVQLRVTFVPTGTAFSLENYSM